LGAGVNPAIRLQVSDRHRGIGFAQKIDQAPKGPRNVALVFENDFNPGVRVTSRLHLQLGGSVVLRHEGGH
jgi:hypothetical protein